MMRVYMLWDHMSWREFIQGLAMMLFVTGMLSKGLEHVVYVRNTVWNCPDHVCFTNWVKFHAGLPQLREWNGVKKINWYWPEEMVGPGR